MKKHLGHVFFRFLVALTILVSLPSCTARYTVQALHDAYPAAEIIETCAHPPTVPSPAVVFAHDTSTGQTISDEDPAAFDEFAKTADVIYLYDPNAPDGEQRLPWPYHHMQCKSLSSSKTPPLPEGLREIPITYALREALVSSLIQSEPDRPIRATEVSNQSAEKRYLGQMGRAGLISPPQAPTVEKIEETGQMLRDSARGQLPKVKGPNDSEISIVDTKTWQFIGGFLAGTAVGFVPGGAFLSNGMRSSAQPTREFSLGDGLGQAGSGVLQMGAGVTGAVVGGGATLTGGGAAVGVPVCVGGIALATNGAITFYNGARTIVLAVCHWEEMPAAEAIPPAVEPASSTGAPPAKPAPSAAKPTNGAKSGLQAATKPVAEAPPPGVTRVTKKPGGTSTATKRRASPGEKPPETQTTITTSETGSVNTTTTRTKPAPSSNPGTNVPKKRGGESPAAAKGRQAHEEFKQKAREKGWDTSYGDLTDPKTGRQVRPDARTREGHPIELKPNTPSGRAAGERQMKKYEAATGKKGRVIYYDP